MCLIAFANNPLDDYPLIIIANRDEFFDRETLALHQWEDHPHIFGGRDRVAGGTWLAMSTSGRWAALTNFRGPVNQPGKISRGQIVNDCLNHSGSLVAFFEVLQQSADHYSGFNFVAGDIITGESYYFSNRQPGIETLPPNFYALSNGFLHDEWPKMAKLRQGLAQHIQESKWTPCHLLDLLNDAEQFELSLLPKTGIHQNTEQKLSSPFVSPFLLNHRMYGTRSSCVIVADRNGRVNLLEKQHLPDDKSHKMLEFTIPLPG